LSGLRETALTIFFNLIEVIMQQEFSVFLSYNSEDRPAVSRIAETLKDHGIRVWVDYLELQPGMPWEGFAERAILECSATAVFIGPKGMGKWASVEMRLAKQRQVEGHFPVIPVLLPGCPPLDEALPPFIKSNTVIDFRERSLDDEQTIRRLRWGITGQKPPAVERPQAMTPAASDKLSQVEDAVSNLARFLRSGNVTFFLGPGASYCDAEQTPSACEVARKLLIELGIIPKDYDKLLPPVDIAGMYYNVRWGDANLASLLNVLRDRPQRRVRQRAQQLIVTTNLDVLTERALLAAGISFTRIVQHRSAQRITINEYRNVQLVPRADGREIIELPSAGGGTQQVAPDDYETLDYVIASHGQRVVDQTRADGEAIGKNPLDELPVHEMTGPILYKHLGSQDVPNSCVISVDHFFTFARRALKRNCIPAKITEIIGNSAVLFLGYSFLDPDFRFTYYTLLRKPFELDMDYRYAVQLPPERFDQDTYRQMEAGLWDHIKKAGLLRLKITTVEEQSADFLERLLADVRETLASCRLST
jgi:hypothetical protein